MQIEDPTWTVPHDADHQFLQDPLPRHHWVLKRWTKYFTKRKVLFDLVEYPAGVFQIYKHRMISLKDEGRPCCKDYQERINGEETHSTAGL